MNFQNILEFPEVFKRVIAAWQERQAAAVVNGVLSLQLCGVLQDQVAHSQSITTETSKRVVGPGLLDKPEKRILPCEAEEARDGLTGELLWSPPAAT